MRKLMLALMLVTVAGLETAQAQEQPAAAGGVAAPGASASGPGGVAYKQKTVYDFDDDTVEGDLVRPDGEMIDSRNKAKHSSLIKIRENFIPEMLKTTEFL